MPHASVALLPGTNPPLPEALKPLAELAYNFHWTLSVKAQSLFERIDPELWISSERNPVKVLAGARGERLAELAGDGAYLHDVRDAYLELRRHLSGEGAWFARHAAEVNSEGGALLVAYFCAEFGIHECFQIYSGGLGLLAGDHLKSAAQLGLPLIGVGLLYRNGYFHQKLSEAGVQVEQYPALDAVRQPVRRVMDLESGRQLTVGVHLPGREVRCALWRADVGSVRLYLLDTNIPENAEEDREITANLYLGDQNRRIQQEIVLGIGGVRALEAIGERATVFHMNEGHAAFLALERIRLVRERTGVAFDQAREAASPGHLFTTHTPVPAGIDHFNVGLVQHYFAGYHDLLGLDMEGFMALGRQNVGDKAEPFSMAVLALRCSKFCNGVSRLHGEVSRVMWRDIWPEVSLSEVPIGHVTNGVNTDTWVSPAMSAIFDRHLGDAWRTNPQDAGAWSGLDKASDAELWQAKQAARAEFVEYCKRQQSRDLTGGIKVALDPEALTIGFARRFAGYKRGTLLLRDEARFEKILAGAGGRPVQFVVSGKSHPGDGWGKNLIKEVVEFARSSASNGRVLFLEDYSIEVAREMVRGCDIWLNTPIRGLEASGTSGMKAAINGVLHASVLDGWWDEGFAPDAGYKIADSGIYASDAPNESREQFESDALYALIENQLIPDFYTRDGAGVPTKWTARMRRCIKTLSPFFSTHRMVSEYAQKYYFPAHNAWTRLNTPDISAARSLADQIDRYRRLWVQTRVKHVEVAAPSRGAAGDISIAASVRLGHLRPDEVLVQAYHGQIDSNGQIEDGTAEVLSVKAPLAGGDGTYQFFGAVRLPSDAHVAASDSHSYGVVVRVLPGDERLANPWIPGLITQSKPVPARAGAATSPVA